MMGYKIIDDDGNECKITPENLKKMMTDLGPQLWRLVGFQLLTEDKVIEIEKANQRAYWAEQRLAELQEMYRHVQWRPEDPRMR